MPYGQRLQAADILHYDRTRPARYPNGRVMTDDVFSARMIFMTRGRANPQAVSPHDDLLAHFPTSARPTPSLRIAERVAYEGRGRPAHSDSPSLEADEPGRAMATSSPSSGHP